MKMFQVCYHFHNFMDLFKDLYVLPDGAVKFREANNQKISYNLQINDLRIQEYHRFKSNFTKKQSF